MVGIAQTGQHRQRASGILRRRCPAAVAEIAFDGIKM
jgi:hypothetical protein